MRIEQIAYAAYRNQLEGRTNRWVTLKNSEEHIEKSVEEFDEWIRSNGLSRDCFMEEEFTEIWAPWIRQGWFTFARVIITDNAAINIAWDEYRIAAVPHRTSSLQRASVPYDQLPAREKLAVDSAFQAVAACSASIRMAPDSEFGYFGCLFTKTRADADAIEGSGPAP
jgi:hypothetical protein